MLPSQTSTPATPFTPTFVQSSQAGRTVELERVIIDDEMIWCSPLQRVG